MADQVNISSTDLQSEANQTDFIIQQVLMTQVNTLITGVITAASGNIYSVQPSINYLGAGGSPIKPAILNNIPACKIRFGAAGIKGTYKVGDAVLLGIVQRDITTLRKNWTQQTNPSSLRRFALPDAIILQGLSNDEPSVNIELTDSAITITAPTINLNGTLNINSQAYASHQHAAGAYTAGGDPVTGNSGGIV